MLSRRIFVQGLTTLVVGFAWKPAWAVPGGPAASVPVAVSARMSDLGDWWEEIGQAYDGTKPRLFTATEASGQELDTDRQDYKLWKEEERRFVHMTAELLREPSRAAGDVILKYHVIDMLHRWRPVGIWIWPNAAQDLPLCELVEREAEQFGVSINPFWQEMLSPLAMIDGDEHSPRWAVIARWRRRGLPRAMAAESERT
jgi:hypothetical protein